MRYIIIMVFLMGCSKAPIKECVEVELVTKPNKPVLDTRLEEVDKQIEDQFKHIDDLMEVYFGKETR